MATVPPMYVPLLKTTTGQRDRRAHPDVKPTNPKDAIGSSKVPLMSVLSWRVLSEVALGMLEGSLKYGRHNYRAIGIRASVYQDATARHMADFWEGQDIDPVSGVHHLSKAISSLMVMRDAIMSGNWTDDRPPRCPPGWVDAANEAAAKLIAKYPEPKKPFTQKGQEESAKTENKYAINIDFEYDFDRIYKNALAALEKEMFNGSDAPVRRSRPAGRGRASKRRGTSRRQGTADHNGRGREARQ